jgi:hypothetical protein
LSWGSLIAAVILGVGLVLKLVGIGGFEILGTLGVVILLVTPAVGLAATWFELRRMRPTHAWLAVAVLVVLALATVVALLPRV